MAKNNREAVDLTCKINIDANDAIKTLKAIQREAREATKALREVEKHTTNVAAQASKPSRV